MLPSTAAQRSVLVQLVDQRNRDNFAEKPMWHEASRQLTQAEALEWINAFRRIHDDAMYPNWEPEIHRSGKDLWDLLFQKQQYRRLDYGSYDSMLVAAMHISRHLPGTTFQTVDELRTALDSDEDGANAHNEGTGAHARAAVIRVGEWVSERIEAGEMADLTFSDLGLAPDPSDLEMVEQMELVRDCAGNAVLEEPSRARAYLAQIGLTETNLGPLSPLITESPYTDTRAVGLACAVRHVLVANHGTALATAEKTDQITKWLMSTPLQSQVPIYWYFLNSRTHRDPLNIKANSHMGQLITAAPDETKIEATWPAQPMEPREPGRKRKAVRTIRDAMNRRYGDASPRPAGSAPLTSVASGTSGRSQRVHQPQKPAHRRRHRTVDLWHAVFARKHPASCHVSTLTDRSSHSTSTARCRRWWQSIEDGSQNEHARKCSSVNATLWIFWSVSVAPAGPMPGHRTSSRSTSCRCCRPPKRNGQFSLLWRIRMNTQTL